MQIANPSLRVVSWIECGWRIIAAWIDTEGNIRIGGMGRTPEVRIWQKTDEVGALWRICELLKERGVTKCAPRPKAKEPQTSEIDITNGKDVALILDNVMPFLIVKGKIKQAGKVRKFLSKRKRMPV